MLAVPLDRAPPRTEPLRRARRQTSPGPARLKGRPALHAGRSLHDAELLLPALCILVSDAPIDVRPTRLAAVDAIGARLDGARYQLPARAARLRRPTQDRGVRLLGVPPVSARDAAVLAEATLRPK